MCLNKYRIDETDMLRISNLFLACCISSIQTYDQSTPLHDRCGIVYPITYLLGLLSFLHVTAIIRDSVVALPKGSTLGLADLATGISLLDLSSPPAPKHSFS
jgi:hypothetical protein